MIFDNISKCPVLRGIEPGQLETVFNEIHYNVKSFDKETVIINRGEVCSNLMILVEGNVRAEMMNFSGNIVKIENIPAPRPIAPVFLFGENNRLPVTVVANDTVRIMFVPKTEVLKLFQKNQIVLENYLYIISSKGQFLSNKVKLLSLDNLKQKIAYHLLENEEELTDRKATQQELAETLGVTRPALTRTLLKLRNENIITYNRDTIKIIDKEKLGNLL